MEEREAENLVQRILAQYRLSGAETSPLGSINNSVYQIQTPTGQKFSLRILPKEWNMRQSLEEELTFLDFVAQRNQVVVPRPVRNLQGELVTVLSTTEGDRLSCLFEWREGQEIKHCLTLPLLKEIGRSVAKLHQIGKEFGFPTPDNHFRRGYHYGKELATSHREWIEVHKEEIGTEHVTLLLSAVEKVVVGMERMGETLENFGFIHADLHFGNFLAQDDQICILDFDQLGRGHYGFDIAILMEELLNEPEPFTLRWESFLSGYQEVADLPFRQESELDIFLIAVHLGFLDWVYNASNPAVRTEKGQYLTGAYENIRAKLS